MISRDRYWNVSRRGSSHILNSTLCQDSSKIFSGEFEGKSFLIASVADGHGQEKYDLSHLGSRFATESAEEILKDIFIKYHSEVDKYLIQTFKLDFPRRVSRLWREKVISDAIDKNLSILEHSSTISRYGTTLLTVLITDNLILCGQIGDGDIFIITQDGIINHPIPENPTLIGSETFSLSLDNAHLLWNTDVISVEHNYAVILASDGLSDSFVSNGENSLNKWIETLINRVKEFGLEKIKQKMPDWLDDISQRGSGDDISMVIALLPSNEDN